MIGRNAAYTSIHASPSRPRKLSKWSSVATSNRNATATIVGIGMRACRHSGCRAAQYEITDADQKPAPTKAAVTGGARCQEKKASVCSLSTKSWVPAKKVRPVRTYRSPRTERDVRRGPRVDAEALISGGITTGPPPRPRTARPAGS
jgi:hypothetical protein